MSYLALFTCSGSEDKRQNCMLSPAACMLSHQSKCLPHLSLKSSFTLRCLILLQSCSHLQTFHCHGSVLILKMETNTFHYRFMSCLLLHVFFREGCFRLSVCVLLKTAYICWVVSLNWVQLNSGCIG